MTLQGYSELTPLAFPWNPCVCIIAFSKKFFARRLQQSAAPSLRLLSESFWLKQQQIFTAAVFGLDLSPNFSQPVAAWHYSNQYSAKFSVETR